MMRSFNAPRGGWAARNDQLAAAALWQLLKEGRDGAYLIFSGEEYYVQFFKDIENSLLLCEAMSGEYLPCQPRLTREARRQLLCFGFQEPEGETRNFHKYGSIESAWAALDTLGTMVVSIMRDVYGVSQNCDLDIEINLEG